MRTCIKVKSSLGPNATNFDRAKTPNSNKITNTIRSHTHMITAMKRKSTKYFLNSLVHEAKQQHVDDDDML